MWGGAACPGSAPAGSSRLPGACLCRELPTSRSRVPPLSHMREGAEGALAAPRREVLAGWRSGVAARHALEGVRSLVAIRRMSLPGSVFGKADATRSLHSAAMVGSRKVGVDISIAGGAGWGCSLGALVTCKGKGWCSQPLVLVGSSARRRPAGSRLRAWCAAQAGMLCELSQALEWVSQGSVSLGSGEAWAAAAARQVPPPGQLRRLGWCALSHWLRPIFGANWPNLPTGQIHQLAKSADWPNPPTGQFSAAAAPAAASQLRSPVS